MKFYEWKHVKETTHAFINGKTENSKMELVMDF
jgi:hypothetical protein